MTTFTHLAVRWGLYVAVSLAGIGYEIFVRESVRWPLMAGYLLVIAMTVYALLHRHRLTASDKDQSTD